MDRGRWSLAMDGRASSGAGLAGRAVRRQSEADVFASSPTMRCKGLPLRSRATLRSRSAPTWWVVWVL